MKISVCIPTYNQGAYIEQAILSAVNQSIQPFEIIISNDCSTDNTRQVLDDLQGRFNNVIVIHQPVNLGISANVSTCLRKASGDYIVRLDSDDILLPEFISKLSSLLDANPLAGYAHSAIQEIDNNGSPLEKRFLYRSSTYQDSEEALKSALKGYRVAANIIMFRKAALEKVGYIRNDQNFAEDYFLAVDIAANGFGNVYCNNILAMYRVWNDSGKIRQKRKLAEIKGLRNLFQDVIKPAFLKRDWNSSVVDKARESFAVTHADCLGWNVYSDAEKLELEKALLQLSASSKTRLFIWLYKNNFGKPIYTYKRFVLFIKQQLKKIKSKS